MTDTTLTKETDLAVRSDYYDGPVWNYFCLTYSAYLVLPRVSLCSMPIGWQRRFVALMQEAERVLPPEVQGGNYMVRKRDGNKFIKDPLSNYRNHGPLALVDGPKRHQIRKAMKEAGVTP